MLELVTYEYLQKLRACEDALLAFKTHFGDAVPPRVLVEVLAKMSPEKRRGWHVWLLRQNPELADTLLAHGADVHAFDDVALREASRLGETELMEIYFGHGANVHARNDEALRNAIDLGRTFAVALCIAHDADVFAISDREIEKARGVGREEIVNLLLHARETRGKIPAPPVHTVVVPPSTVS
ncbi:MAG: hypothetical protein A3D67_00245 [Candidatus Lloydbacteria bacterium RIFCSPHIGHO2_02_FULL_51_22]|uniref:Ankyrin repeat domain-containing protein n=3 Tax=Candidatus Lloydiibacteriota TaxID=1817910 RepID=A0A1G2DF47_9BACT|nr:MAG: hypothetical protein A3D67_00245 [Candidatus Lloydbacteria bacterium RIFCSPHIGHO2_02_FULL_51_22]OGZ15718.1 MAG: hypothetical protein A3J08_02525 [Candidatus Lloydbacteria bacterium RIFCSPLOWO2_02_FULL_51_11]OGZ16163.1 MAG: hypothetical protein A3G11_03045 [Candidatus Lloydbacteria bacterium RIFCSPLOWO2_12_FULL_51_9]